MNREINYYVSAFENVFNGEPWYGKSLLAVLEDVDTKTVYKNPGGEAHSIFEIVHHLYAWRNLLVKRLQGDTRSKISMNSTDDWAPLPGKQDEAAWNELIRKLELDQQALIPALAQWKDEDLDRAFAGTEYPMRTFLDGHLQHDIYHIGQLAHTIKTLK